MTQAVLFHHVQGLTAGVTAFADVLRTAGHDVHTPDLFNGRTFETLDAGIAHVESVGFAAIIERGVAAAEAIGGASVFVGFSLGVVPAQMLAQTSPDAVGAVLCHACVPVSEFGDAWPAAVPVQVHGMDADPYFVDEGDIEAARALVESSACAELFLYHGTQHLFADASLPSYNAAAAALLVDRTLDLLGSVAEASR